MQFIDNSPILNVFKYITFRSGLAIFTSLFIWFIFGKYFISELSRLQNGGQPIREDGPQTHFVKKGTPTMGGILIIISIVVSTLLWADITNPFIWISLFVLVTYGLIGFIDDYKKIKFKDSKGIKGKTKLLWQIAIAVISTFAITKFSPASDSLSVVFPFFKNLTLDLGIFFFIFGAIVLTGSSNAVNLTDGLDGLAIGPVIIVSVCFALISYLVGNIIFADYLHIIHIPLSGELTILCAAIVGAGIGFLWFNAPPAEVFMGDVGSLSLGGIIGTISLIIKHEVVLAIIGGVFVIEAISVIIQVYYFKYSGGKRFFLMAPIHHHFEKKGWKETKVVMRFWIISVIFALIGLATLKLR
jgi:phospho-N-acetylmuramoyl-pentapeptide-transferase